MTVQPVRSLKRESPSRCHDSHDSEPIEEPWTEILEEPMSTGLRFRYKCEGQSAGSIVGVSSTSKGPKVFPRIKINGLSQAAIVIVSCVGKDPPYRPHPNALVGQQCEDGVCILRVKGRDDVTLYNVGIQCCKRQDIKVALELRQKLRVDPFATGYALDPKDMKGINLSVVRLCFQVFINGKNSTKFNHALAPVVSQEIVDKRLANNLVICRLNKQAGFAKGGDEVFLLCEKIKKEDIIIRFFEEDHEGSVVWESDAEFNPQDVHHQCGLVFKTPSYHDQAINTPASVFIQLVRPSDLMAGDRKPFMFIPNEVGSNGDGANADLKRKNWKVMKRSAAHISALDDSFQSNDGSSTVGAVTPIQCQPFASANVPLDSHSTPRSTVACLPCHAPKPVTASLIPTTVDDSDFAFDSDSPQSLDHSPLLPDLHPASGITAYVSNQEFSTKPRPFSSFDQSASPFDGSQSYAPHSSQSTSALNGVQSGFNDPRSMHYHSLKSVNDRIVLEMLTETETWNDAKVSGSGIGILARDAKAYGANAAGIRERFFQMNHREQSTAAEGGAVPNGSKGGRLKLYGEIDGRSGGEIHGRRDGGIDGRSYGGIYGNDCGMDGRDDWTGHVTDVIEEQCSSMQELCD